MTHWHTDIASYGVGSRRARGRRLSEESVTLGGECGLYTREVGEPKLEVEVSYVANLFDH